MKNTPDKIKEIAGLHSSYWLSKSLNKYVGGPFPDRSGGLITFNCDSLEKATSIVNSDPFLEFELIDKYWIKIWEPK